MMAILATTTAISISRDIILIKIPGFGLRQDAQDNINVAEHCIAW
jgi:hypothetical protein